MDNFMNSLLASLHYFGKSLILVMITTLVVAGIVTLLWNGQVVLITALALPEINFWQAFAVIGIIQFIRIKI
jgi:hypothetical protein